MIKKSLLILLSLFILLSCADRFTAPFPSEARLIEEYGIDVSLPYEELKQKIKEKLKAYFEKEGSYRIIFTGIPREYNNLKKDTLEIALLNALIEMDLKNITIDVDLRYINFINGTLPRNMFGSSNGEKYDYLSVFYNFIFPENKITSIGDNAFTHNWSIKEIVMPDSVTEIWLGIFSFCNRLEKVTLGKGIKRLDNFPFEKSFSLKEIDTSRCSSLEYIEGWTLASLPALTEFAIPASVKEIDRYAFYECSNLTTIIYYGDSPDNIKFLDKDIFVDCPEVKNLIVPNAINPDDPAWKTFGNGNFTYVEREKPKQ